MDLSCSLDFARLAAAYAAGTLTPGSVVREVYARIEAGDPNPIWIYRLPQDVVTARARELEARRKAGAVLPLYGVPFAIKDNIDAEGHPTTAACPAYSYVPTETAHAVRRLEGAGALLIGKTNLDQFATGLTGTRSPYGACFNPFNPDYLAGGSSSGSALAVATGLVSFALGTDTAGSGRVPAGFNNVVGLKPTPGRVSTRGVLPACRSLDCVSVFALTCEDGLAVLDVAQGYDEQDPYSRRAEDANLPLGPHFRCGVPAPLEFFGDAAAQAAFARARSALAAAGAQFVEVDYAPFLEAARLLYEGPWVAERQAAVGSFIGAHPEAVVPVVHEIISGAARWSAADAYAASYRLRELKRRCEAGWEKMDVLAVPTTGAHYTLAQVAAEPLGLNRNLGHYTNFVNLFDLCALSVPGPFRDDGLPAGVTLIAPAWRDRWLAQAGSRMHRASGVKLGATGFDLPPLAAAPKTEAADGAVLAVVGAHLSGLPLNHQLTERGAKLLETTRTSENYRLYALPGTQPARPGLVRVLNGSGTAIEVELWTLPVAAFGSFVAQVPPPLAIGTVTLADGREVKGFVCENYAVAGARDVSEHGGWRAYLQGA